MAKPFMMLLSVFVVAHYGLHHFVVEDYGLHLYSVCILQGFERRARHGGFLKGVLDLAQCGMHAS
jgi:hypothetical protein